MILRYEKSNDNEKKADKAISICLYKTERFNYTKHIEPLNKFIEQNDKMYDILIFHEKGIEKYLSQNDNVRTFNVISEQENYQKHIWRYIGCRENYESIWFRGADTIEIPPREKILEQITKMFNNELLIFPSVSSSGYVCTGRLLCNKTGKLKINSLLENKELIHTHWHCDEEFLSEWVINNDSLKITVALDKSLNNLNKISQWLNNRLNFGAHTLVIKDRDDTTLKSKI